MKLLQIFKNTQLVLTATFILCAPIGVMAQDGEQQLSSKEQVRNQLEQVTFKAVRDRLAPATAGLSGFTSVVENFLPDFQLSSLFANDGDTASEQPITMDFGFLLFGKSELGNNAKVKATINRGAVPTCACLSNYYDNG